MALNEMNRMKSTPDMKTNAKLRREAAARRQPRIVTDAISKTINLNLTTSTAAPSGAKLVVVPDSDTVSLLYGYSLPVDHVILLRLNHFSQIIIRDVFIYLFISI